jgi:hypothetical protein
MKNQVNDTGSGESLVRIFCISPNSISVTKFSVCQIIHCKLPITVIDGTNWPEHFHGIHI